MTLRLMASGALAAAVAAIVVGCGAGADLSSVAKAASKTQDTKTSGFSMSFVGPEASEFVAVGAIDFAAHSGIVKVRDGGGKNVFEAIWNSSSLYLKSPELTGPLGGTKPWIKMQESTDFAQFAQLPLFDPAKQFDLLREAGHFDAAGTDDVRGVPTTRYEGKVDLKTFLQEFLPEGAQDELPNEVGGKRFAVEAWIDGDGLLRKVVYDLPNAGPDNRAGRLTLELHDFGAPVDSSPPPADQVGEMPKVPPLTGTLQTVTIGG